MFLESGCTGTPGPLGTSQPSLDEARHSHSSCHEPPRAPDSPLLWEKYLSSPKRPFHSASSPPAWDQGIASPAKDSFFRPPKGLVCKESYGSPAISSALGAILPAGSPARPACNSDQQRGLARPVLGGLVPPTLMAHGSTMLPSIYLGCNIDCSSVELITPCKEMLPEKRAKRDTPKQLRAWQAQTVKGHLATSERQMDAAITTQIPIKSLCPQTGDITQCGKASAPAFPPALGLLGCPSSLSCQGKGCRARQLAKALSQTLGAT